MSSISDLKSSMSIIEKDLVNIRQDIVRSLVSVSELSIYDLSDEEKTASVLETVVQNLESSLNKICELIND